MKKQNLFPIYMLLCIILVLCIYNLYRGSKTKLASIDTAKVLKAYKNVAALSKNLEEQSTALKLRLDTLASEFQEAVKTYEKKRSTLSDVERKSEEIKLRQKQDQYTQYQSVTQDNLKKQEVKVIEQALAKINAKIIAYAKNKGYTAILAISPGSGLIYADDYMDITDELIPIIND